MLARHVVPPQESLQRSELRQTPGHLSRSLARTCGAEVDGEVLDLGHQAPKVRPTPALRRGVSYTSFLNACFGCLVWEQNPIDSTSRKNMIYWLSQGEAQILQYPISNDYFLRRPRRTGIRD